MLVSEFARLQARGAQRCRTLMVSLTVETLAGSWAVRRDRYKPRTLEGGAHLPQCFQRVDYELHRNGLVNGVNMFRTAENQLCSVEVAKAWINYYAVLRFWTLPARWTCFFSVNTTLAMNYRLINWPAHSRTDWPSSDQTPPTGMYIYNYWFQFTL